ncbi:MAG: hypothetical protein Q4D53_06855, partial [Leptotrichiaceae bacterium]|nr:hypothetical protein [Leptotrichiaceae bacterium]
MKPNYKNKIHIAFIYVLLTVMAIIAVFPLTWIILSSIKPSGEMSKNPLAFIPKKITLDYYKQVLFDLNFMRNIKNSIIISFMATLITITVSSLGAYGIVRFFPKVGKKMTKLLITTYMFPTILLAGPYVTVMARLGLINTWT